MPSTTPITPLGIVWMALYRATIVSDRANASTTHIWNEVCSEDSMALDEEEVESIVLDLWESGIIRLDDFSPSGKLLFRFPEPCSKW